MCIKKLNENTKCFKFNEGKKDTKYPVGSNEPLEIKIVGGRPPIYYNTAIRYNNYLINIRKLINKELQSKSL